MAKPETSRRRRSSPKASTLANASAIFKSNRRERKKSSSKSAAREIPRNNSAISAALKKETFPVRFLSFAHQLLLQKLRPNRASTPESQSSKSRRRSRRRQGSPKLMAARMPQGGRNTSTTTSDSRRRNANGSLHAHVPVGVLEGGKHGPFRPPFFKRVAQRFRPKTSVSIEALEASGLSTSVLYASEDIPSDSRYPFAKTDLISGRPHRDEKSLVYQDSPFEIRIAGMLVRKFDKGIGPSGDNELLMYSIQTDPSTSGETNESLPFIHFDHYRDGSKFSETPNTYVPIPASKSFVTGSFGTKRGCMRRCRQGGSAKEAKAVSHDGSARRSCREVKSDKSGKHSKDRKMATKMKDTSAVDQKSLMRQTSAFALSNPETKKSINVQFKIIELDQPNEATKQAINGIDQLSGFVSGYASAAPFLGVLSPALTLAGAVSKRALDSYAKPDKVLSIDMDFLLADRDRVRSGQAPPGEYLRYGYYFFLAEPVEGKLYASVQTPKNVQLMLHRRKGDTRVKRQFFPLTEISYLVVRVSEPTFTGNPNRRPIHMRHANQLEEIFKTAKTKEDPKKVKDAINRLGKELGFDSKSPK